MIYKSSSRRIATKSSFHLLGIFLANILYSDSCTKYLTSESQYLLQDACSQNMPQLELDQSAPNGPCDMVMCRKPLGVKQYDFAVGWNDNCCIGENSSGNPWSSIGSWSCQIEESNNIKVLNCDSDPSKWIGLEKNCQVFSSVPTDPACIKVGPLGPSPGVAPCSNYLAPGFTFPNCNDQKLAVFDPNTPLGTVCSMTLCRHEFYGPNYVNYALGFASDCCTHSGSDPWSSKDDDHSWTCTIKQRSDGLIGLDCNTGNEAKWDKYDGACSVFESIPLVGSCGNWAPSSNPDSCEQCCCPTIDPACTFKNPHPPADRNCSTENCDCLDPPIPP